ncbi:hypothetical protein Pelo_5589 [Pelomyxa schiedti]|nr:hypothetical protein Pelo_5589 [Pelomyxa schiedti]
MGVVDRPAVVDYGKHIFQYRGCWAKVSRDQKWKPGSSWELVLNNSPGVRRCSNVVATVPGYGNSLAVRGRWVVNDEEWTLGGHALGLWDFGEIERGVVSNAAIPWQLEVVNMVFLSDDSLAVMHQVPTGRAVDVIDLAATMQHKELRVVSRFTIGPEQSGPFPMWCWGGKVYTATDRYEHLVCATTGERTQLPAPPGLSCRALHPVGGPYFTLTELFSGRTVEVFSVVEPTKVCFRYFPKQPCNMTFWNELALREEGTEFQVSDLASGLPIFTMTTGVRLFVQSVS